MKVHLEGFHSGNSVRVECDDFITRVEFLCCYDFLSSGFSLPSFHLSHAPGRDHAWTTQGMRCSCLTQVGPAGSVWFLRFCTCLALVILPILVECPQWKVYRGQILNFAVICTCLTVVGWPCRTCWPQDQNVLTWNWMFTADGHTWWLQLEALLWFLSRRPPLPTLGSCLTICPF